MFAHLHIHNFAHLQLYIFLHSSIFAYLHISTCGCSIICLFTCTHICIFTSLTSCMFAHACDHMYMFANLHIYRFAYLHFGNLHVFHVRCAINTCRTEPAMKRGAPERNRERWEVILLEGEIIDASVFSSSFLLFPCFCVVFLGFGRQCPFLSSAFFFSIQFSCIVLQNIRLLFAFIFAF